MQRRTIRHMITYQLRKRCAVVGSRRPMHAWRQRMHEFSCVLRTVQCKQLAWPYEATTEPTNSCSTTRQNGARVGFSPRDIHPAARSLRSFGDRLTPRGGAFVALALKNGRDTEDRECSLSLHSIADDDACPCPCTKRYHLRKAHLTRAGGDGASEWWWMNGREIFSWIWFGLIIYTQVQGRVSFWSRKGLKDFASQQLGIVWFTKCRK